MMGENNKSYPIKIDSIGAIASWYKMLPNQRFTFSHRTLLFIAIIFLFMRCYMLDLMVAYLIILAEKLRYFLLASQTCLHYFLLLDCNFSLSFFEGLPFRTHFWRSNCFYFLVFGKKFLDLVRSWGSA